MLIIYINLLTKKKSNREILFCFIKKEIKKENKDSTLINP